MLPAFLATCAWLPALLGLGALVRHRGDPALRPALAGLFGLAVLGLAAAAVHLALPISPAVSGALWAAGISLAWRRRRWLLEAFSARDAVPLLALLALLCLAARPPAFHYDTGFYHLQAVQWLTSRRLVPGIANLHHRLGFNTLWLATAAGLELPLAAGKSAFFAAQLPLLCAAAAALVGLRRLAAGDRSFSNLLLAAALLPAASATIALGGLYADYPAALVAYLSLALFARAFEAGERFGDDALPAALLALLAALLKLSLLLLPAGALLLLAARRSALPRRFWVGAAGLAAAAVVPWLLRGVLLSGCLAFPAASSCLPFLPFTVPAGVAEEGAAAVRWWARWPGGPRELALHSWSWLPGWRERVLRDYPELRLLLVALVAGLCGSAIVWRRAPAEARRGLAAVGGLSGVALGWWFLTAPDPRFALGPLYAFGLAPLCLALSAWRRGPWSRPARLAAVAAVAVAALGLGMELHGLDRNGMGVAVEAWTPPLASWPELPDPELARDRTASGVEVLVSNEQCWGAPAPCTPEAELDPALRFEGWFARRPR